MPERTREQPSQDANATPTAISSLGPDAVFISDASGCYIDVNDAGCALLSYPRSEILGKSARDFCGIADPTVRSQLQSRLRVPGDLRFESMLRRRDGTVMPVDVHTQLLPSGERLSIVRDITERRRREREEQREREILTRSQGLSTLYLSGQSDEVICTAILDAAISLSGADCGYLQTYEADTAELCVAAVRNLAPAWRERPARGPAALGVAGMALAERTRIIVHDVATYGQGTPAAVPELARLAGVRALQVTPLFSRAGEPLAVISTGYQAQPLPPPEELQPLDRLAQHATDILAHLRAQGRLRRAEALAAGILSVASDAVLCVDAQRRITQWNDAAVRMFGYSRREAIGLSLEQLLPKGSRSVHREHIERVLAETGPGRPVNPSTPTGLRRNGEEFPIDAMMAPIEVDGSRWLTIAVRDISEQRRVDTEQRLLAALAGAPSPLDYDQTLQLIVNIATEHLAEFAVLFVIEEGGSKLRRAAATARDPKLGWAAAQMMHLPENPPLAHPIWRVIREQRPIIAGLDAEQYAAMAQSPEHLRALQAASPKSAVVMPLVTAGTSIGALGLSRASSHFDERDLQLIETIARCCALYIENARLQRCTERTD